MTKGAVFHILPLSKPVIHTKGLTQLLHATIVATAIFKKGL